MAQVVRSKQYQGKLTEEGVVSSNVKEEKVTKGQA